MHILMVSTSYPADRKDWKALFIRQLGEALARRQDIRLSLWAPPGETDPRIERSSTAEEAEFLKRLASQGGIAHLLRTRRIEGLVASARLLMRLRRAFVRSDADAYHVNWLQNAIALPDDGKPALVSVLGTDMRLAHSPIVRLTLRRAFRQRQTTICPNADWMAEDLIRWFGDVAHVVPVPFGIDPLWFDANRVPARSPAQWLVVSRLTSDKLGTLFEWAAPWFSTGERRLHLVGPMQERLELPPWLGYSGPATPDELVTRWFPNATGLITLSRHAEGRPQVMLEAMAAGLPIIASRLPAHEDLLRDGETGYLVDDSEQLGQRLLELEDERAAASIGAAARADVRRRVGSWDDCASRYFHLYQRLLGETT